eukprot:scaffold7367_cov270-Pinguiococcus_pyrenoidosus.AAC.4
MAATPTEPSSWEGGPPFSRTERSCRIPSPRLWRQKARIAWVPLSWGSAWTPNPLVSASSSPYPSRARPPSSPTPSLPASR